MKRIKSDRILFDNTVFDGYIYFDRDRITEVSTSDHSVDTEYDMTGNYVSAGFIDIHTHGGGGNAFEGSVEEIIAGCEFHLQHGTTSICPTISAAPLASMAHSTENVKQAMHDPRVRSTIIGAHLEGPYLSRRQCGAQCADFITAPNEQAYLPLLARCNDAIARWSFAPENDQDARFAAALRKYGVVASAGHTDATYDDMLRAIENGCELITHLYSCTSTITRDHGFRRLGVIETAYLLDSLYVEIICDGKHLPPELIRLIYQIKGPDRIALVTDSLALAGTAQTHGFMQNTEFIIEDGVCKLMDRSAFAGSIATADRLVRVAVKEAGIPLTDAIKMITETPAKIMRLKRKGQIAPDMDADLVVFDENIGIRQVFAMGEPIL